MAEKNISEYGGKILNSLNKAVESGDFSNLSDDVKGFINEVAKGGYKSSGNTNSEKYAYKHKNYFSGNNLGSEISDSLQSGLKYVVSSLKNEQDSHFVSSKINKYSAGLSSILKIIFGFIIDFISGAVLCDYLASSGSAVKVNTSSVYNILSQLALTGIYRHRLSANNKMYFDVNSARHIHLYDLSTHTFRDLPDDEFSEMVFAKLGRKRFKGFKIENVDVQILVRPTQKSSKK